MYQSRNPAGPARFMLPVVEDSGRISESLRYDWDPERSTKDFYRQWFHKEVNSTYVTSTASSAVMLGEEKRELMGTIFDQTLNRYLNRSPRSAVFFVFATLGLMPVTYRRPWLPCSSLTKSTLLYCVSVYVIVSVCMWHVLYDRMPHLLTQSRSMELRLLSFEMIMNLLTNVLVPLIWLDANRLTDQPFRQALFEKHYHDVVGEYFDWGTLPARAWVVCIGIVASSPIVFFTMYLTLPDLEIKLYYGPAYIYANVVHCMVAGAMYFRSTVLYYSAKQLRNHFVKVTEKSNVTKADIRNIRELWAELRNLFGEKMIVTPLVPLLNLLFIFIMLTVTTFEFLSFLGSSSTNLAGAQLVFALTYFIELSLVCNVSQTAAEEMQNGFLTELDNLASHDLTNEAFVELHFFYQTITSNPAGIVLAGFVKVDRSLVATMLTTMVTYLIVLVQFQMSVQSMPAQSNSTVLV